MLSHLRKRRFQGLDPKHVAGITGRDFSDIFRQFAFFERVGYPLHHTGMLDAAVLAWNHRSHPCTAVFACLWHNQVSAGWAGAALVQGTGRAACA